MVPIWRKSKVIKGNNVEKNLLTFAGIASDTMNMCSIIVKLSIIPSSYVKIELKKTFRKRDVPSRTEPAVAAALASN
jgi:hypothetical protein